MELLQAASSPFSIWPDLGDEIGEWDGASRYIIRVMMGDVLNWVKTPVKTPILGKKTCSISTPGGQIQGDGELKERC